MELHEDDGSRSAKHGGPFTMDDSLWNLAGIGDPGPDGPTDVSENKYPYLADAYAPPAGSVPDATSRSMGCTSSVPIDAPYRSQVHEMCNACGGGRAICITATARASAR